MAVRRADRDDALGVARVGDRHLAVALGRAGGHRDEGATLVAGGHDDDGAAADQALALFADGRSAAGEGADLVVQREAEVDAVDDRHG